MERADAGFLNDNGGEKWAGGHTPGRSAKGRPSRISSIERVRKVTPV
jgi:hypothetical protein